MKKTRLLILTLFIAGVNLAYSQVDDINFIVAPKASYHFFDKKNTADNAFGYGVEAGFGFGKVIELRGFYQRSLMVGQNLNRYQNDFNDFVGANSFTMPSHSILMSRMGGELKGNIQIGRYSPYVLLGIGAETLENHYDNSSDIFKSENLFGQVGLGLKINITPRITWDLDVRTTVYNMNPNGMLNLKDEDGNDLTSVAYEDWRATLESKTMFNWEVNTGFTFYLGGTNTEKMDEMERAYYEKFRNELSGVKFTLTPRASFLNFNDNSTYRNALMLGGALGIDFSDYLGVELYYAHAFSGKNSNTKFFEKLGMFGGDLVGRLNIPRGIMPYITIGGGAIYNGNNYVGKEIIGQTDADYTYNKNMIGFAKGGLGIEIPLANFVSLYGSANILFTVEDNVDATTLNSTSQLMRHSSFDAGVRFKIGKKYDFKKKDSSTHLEAPTEKSETTKSDNTISDDEINYNKRTIELSEQLNYAFDRNNNEEIERVLEEKRKLDAEYSMVIDKKIDEEYLEKTADLKEKLGVAFQENDTEAIKELMEAKKNLDLEYYNLNDKNEINDNLIRLSPEELQKLIDETIDRVIEEEENRYYDFDTKKRLDKIEEVLQEILKQNSKEENEKH